MHCCSNTTASTEEFPPQWHYLPSHVVKVCEDEGPRDIKPARDDVLGVLPRQPPRFLHREALPQVLLVVRELDDEGDVEGLLQPPGKGREGNAGGWIQRMVGSGMDEFREW